MKPRVSVLLPVRDAREHLEAALESLAAQTLERFEVVAVDDGSRDDSGAILRAWRRRLPTLRVLSLERVGLVPALNEGLAACRAPVVGRMDADDVAHPRRLERQLRLLESDSAPDVVSCGVRHFDDGAKVGRGLRIYEEWLNALVRHEEIVRERFIESPLPHPTVMARRWVLEEAGGYRDRGWPEDYDLWLRLAESGRRFAKVPEVLLRWRDHPARLTRSDSRYAVERFLECKAHFLTRGPLADSPRLVIWGAGQTGRRLSKHLVRRHRSPAAFLDIDRRKWGRTLRGAPVHPPHHLSEIAQGSEPAVVLAAVSSRGARAKIRRRLNRLGLVEGRNYWCVA